VRRTAEEIGITFVQSHAPMGRPIVKDEAYPRFMEINRRCIQACAMLGIPNVVVHSGYAPGLSVEETFERNKAFYGELLPDAERFGVEILTENFNRMYKPDVYWVDSAPDLRALIDYIDHPLLHACWDAGHGNLQDMPQDEALRILGDHVHALHVQDNLGDKDTHLAPFFGTLNLDALMHGLADIGYKGYFTFEATQMLLPAGRRRAYEGDQRLVCAPLELRKQAEALLYGIGCTVLDAYGCLEE
ncbi:MAG: sugar phosphate isomerase/epimerase, partial [Clostridia bacterium]|nr:sugar phosphate isomerase/epimerase [Clostridia bacterium]